ncbi:sensor histidine kinase, partial [Pseudomonas viridiflava]|uniref:sensor histidine kinase n=1 Tax=Pseudomonas viridiflava TaxID=33069 RepID=UPI001F1553CD
ALVNMVVNARDAMAGSGRLTITVERSACPSSELSPSLSDGDYVTVTLTDTGSGIPKEKLGLIFEPFYTTKSVGQGTGLGLSQVFGFAKQSGGEV